MDAEAYAICKNNKCKRDVYTAEQVDALAMIPVGGIYLTGSNTGSLPSYGGWGYCGKITLSDRTMSTTGIESLRVYMRIS